MRLPSVNLRTSFFFLALHGSLAFAAIPKVGTPAPDLAFTAILQAPEATKADWASLKGKTVVLNFWATWCAPCVAELPLLNALIKSVDSTKVQLIAADYNGEDRAKVALFLKQHPVSGWIGLDPAEETQRRFGVTAVPVTFIIGPDGRVAHVTEHPETLTGEQLTALAEGKEVTFDDRVKASAALLDDQKKAAAAAEKVKIASLVATNGRILAVIAAPAHSPALTLAEAASAPDDGLPADLVRVAAWEPGRFNLVDGRVQDLVAQAFDSRATRVVLPDASTGARYNMHVHMPGATPEALRRSMEQAFASGLGIKVERRVLSRNVLILEARAGSARSPDSAATPPEHYCYFNPLPPPNQALTCASASFGDLADAVEDFLETPVLDETGLKGAITATLPVPVRDRESVAALLSKNFGVILTPAKRSIETLVVSTVSPRQPR